MTAAADSPSKCGAAVQFLSQRTVPTHAQMALMSQEEKLVRDRRRTVSKAIKQEPRRVEHLHTRLNKLPVADVLDYVSANVRVQIDVSVHGDADPLADQIHLRRSGSHGDQVHGCRLGPTMPISSALADRVPSADQLHIRC